MLSHTSQRCQVKINHVITIGKDENNIRIEEFYLSGEQKVRNAIETYKTFFIDGVDIDGYYLEGIL